MKKILPFFLFFCLFSCKPATVDVDPVQTKPAYLGIYSTSTFICTSDTTRTAPTFQSDGTNNMGIYTLDNGSDYYIDGHKITVAATQHARGRGDSSSGDVVLVLTINGVAYINTYFMGNIGYFDGDDAPPAYDGTNDPRDLNGTTDGAYIWKLQKQGTTLEWNVSNTMDSTTLTKEYTDYPITTSETFFIN